jgi:hypothetical protein
MSNNSCKKHQDQVFLISFICLWTVQCECRISRAALLGYQCIIQPPDLILKCLLWLNSFRFDTRAEAGRYKNLSKASMSNTAFDKIVKEEIARLQLLHPTPDDIPGCISTFDEYLACNGEKGRFSDFNSTLTTPHPVIRTQIKNIYRFGERTKCDRKFQDFKFCLSMKTMYPEERRDAWIRRRAEWWASRRLGRSSEDVWDVRE